MSKLFRYGGIAASVVLIAFGVGSVVGGIDGRDQVHSDLAREQIVGPPDSTIPNQKVDTGSEAQAFATVMRKHSGRGGQGGRRGGRAAIGGSSSTRPDALLIQDPTLLHLVDVFGGLRDGGRVVINTGRPIAELGLAGVAKRFRLMTMPATERARERPEDGQKESA